jgi:hypothetical protein
MAAFDACPPELRPRRGEHPAQLRPGSPGGAGVNARHRIAPICAGCGSRHLVTAYAEGGHYGVCLHCERLQELETRADPSRQLCDDCAFRPGSPERADPWGWMRMTERHIEDGVPFYCHKGLALEFDPQKAMMTVKVAPGLEAEATRKPCAGWLAQRRAYLAGQVTA